MEAIRSEPYRLFFPLGIALAWAGVGHWLAYALGWFEDFRIIFHAMTQIEGFLTAFAVGFLFTMIPRRTETPPPATWQIVLAAIGPVGVVVSAWLAAWAWSLLFWLLVSGVVLGFLVRRLSAKRAKRRPPNAFVWLPTAYVMGITGGILIAVGAAKRDPLWWLHEVGRGIVLQGVFVALIIGVGALALPLMTRAEKPADATDETKDRLERMGHYVAALALFGSFFVEDIVSVRSGLIVRAAVVFVVLLTTAEIHRPPKRPGVNAKLMWLAMWMLPLGYLYGAIDHENYKVGLHIAFIGGFSLLVLAVSTHVALGHGGRMDRLTGRPPASFVLGLSLIAAMIPRALMVYDRPNFFVWLGVAAGLFLTGTVAWLFLVADALRPPAASEPTGPAPAAAPRPQ